MDEQENITVVLEQVLKAKDLLSVTRLLAATLMDNPYETIGNFMSSLTNEDLKSLLNISEDVEDDKFGNLILISEMLAGAEGAEPSHTDEDVTNRVSQFVVFLTIESLARKGLVKLYRENMSFGEDAGDKILVERIEGADEDEQF
jgi:hypothetical protein